MSALELYLELRRDAAAERIGDGGPDLCDALTTALDAAVAELAADAPPAGPLCVVALGGYGRREQCLHSDVDLMILHRNGAVDAVAAAIFRPLWDAGLRVGHSVRTPSEAAGVARAHFDALTSLLSARPIAGNADVFAELARELARVVAGKPLAPMLAAAERQRREWNPYPVMAADLKDGRGALRTLQGLQWERQRAALLGIETTTPEPEEREAFATLLAVRNALHAAAGRSHDVFSPELREPAARWLGRQPRVAAGLVTRALATGDRLAELAWPDMLTDQDDPLRSFRARLVGVVRSRFRTAPDADRASPLGAAVRAVSRPGGPIGLGGAAFAPPGGGDLATWTPGDRNAFVQLIAAGARGRAAFTLLDREGWVDAAFPEWAIVRSAPQLAPFHDHPVGAHLWRTVDEMRELVEGSDPDLAGIADEVGSTEELYLAAFFHDIGKGRGSDHSKVGAAVTQAFLRRSGFGPATTSAVVHAVRHHLLLANTAFRRDIGRSEVIDDVIDAVGTLRRLQVLYLLTIADLRATGTSSWTEWRATLLRSLYVACAARLEATESAAAPTTRPDIADYLTAAPHHDARAVEEHLAAMPAEYTDVCTPLDVAWHLDVVSAREGPVELAVRAHDVLTEVLLTADDRPGLLAAVASVFAANGIAVLEAHLFTRDDGLVLDRFVTRRDRGDGDIDEARWGRVRADLADVLDGGLDVSQRVADRVRAYERPGAAPIPVVVSVVDQPATQHSAVTVRCADRIGRLAQIVSALRDAGCDVHFAKLDVRGAEVVDTFLVRRNGHPLRDHDARAELVARLTADLER